MEDKELVLDEMIKNFYTDKQEADHFKKMADDFNAAIKTLMAELDKEEFVTSNGLIAKRSVQKRESFNEGKLIERLKELGAVGAIKTVEVVDYDKLEDAIYNEEFDATKIADCKQIKEVITLKVTQKKGE